MSDPIFPAAPGRGEKIGAAVRALAVELERPVVLQEELPVAADADGEAEQDPQLKALAARFSKRIKYFNAQVMKPLRTQWEKNRECVDGDVEDDGEKGLVRVNLAASVVNTIQPNVYAKAPEVSVQPDEQIDPAQYKRLRPFAKTLELALNRLAIRDTFLKIRGKEAVRASLTCTTGWVKVLYQRDAHEDPVIRNRINDTQDNVLRIEQLLRETKDEGQGAEYEANLASLRQQIAALEAKVEVVASEGLVIDNVAPEHVVILDASVKTIDEYTQASAIAHGFFMTVAAYKAKFGGKEPPKKATRFNGESESDESGENRGGRVGMDDDDRLVLIWEVWSKDDLTVYTLCDGAEEFCRPPFQPVTLGQQWYPLFPLQLWRVHGRLFARSLVENLKELVDEYNTRRTTDREHRRKNKPVRIFNTASGISDEELTRINRRSDATDILGVSADANQPLQNQIASFPEIPYNPAMYDVSDILRDIEMTSGAQDASRGTVNVAKTAREAEIQAMGMQSRTGDQMDMVEDWLSAIMTYCAQLLLLNVTPQQIQAKFGAAAVWPEFMESKKEFFELTQVTIRAGSTAKPNKMRERDQWLQFLPQLNQAIIQISELERNGQTDVAEALMKVLEETLRRFDERLSIKEFIPGQGEDEEGEGGQPNLQKQMQVAQERIQQMMQQAQEALQERAKQVEQQEARVQQAATALQVKQIDFDAKQEVASVRALFEARQRKLEAREAADEVVRKVTAIMDKTKADMQAAIGTAQPLDAVVDDVHAVVAPALAVIDPPELAPFEADNGSHGTPQG